MARDESKAGLPGIVDESIVTSMSCAGEVRILIRGYVAYAFRMDDLSHRDVVIAALFGLGLSGKRVASLCEVSESEVSRVRSRYEEGGTSALLRPAPKRREVPPLSTRQKNKAIALRRSGKAIDSIASELGISRARVTSVLDGVGLGSVGRGGRVAFEQLELSANESLDGGEVDDPGRAKERRVAKSPTGTPPPIQELRPGAAIASSTTHASRYAGLALLTSALCDLGFGNALQIASATRGTKAVYSATTIATTMAAAFAANYLSIESMHERDAHGLGLVLGLERCPSVRTLHRATREMACRLDAVALHTEFARHLARRSEETTRVFGVDLHFKAYFGKAPIDKGWDSKRRIAQRGLSDVLVTDPTGRTWIREQVGAGDGLASHLTRMSERLAKVLGPETTIVLGFDRGGFDFDVLAALDAAGVKYIGWVPFSVKLPDLAAIAPDEDGIGEAEFAHERVTHACRLIVERDGRALLPACTNLSASVDATNAMDMLRSVRGMQENSFKAARRRTGIDRLSDRGGATTAPDDRIVDNPAYLALREKLEGAIATTLEIESCPERCVQNGRWTGEYVEADLRRGTFKKLLRDTPARVRRIDLDPTAKRAWLRTTRRELVVPLRYAADNALRDLVDWIGAGLSSTDEAHDATARARTLLALVRAPGTIRFDVNEVLVTLDFPLPKKSHERLAEALSALDERDLRFSDGMRRVRFRLAKRITRDMVEGVRPR